MPHKVSVIIPIYNRADLLPRAMSSVLNQTFQDFELIIVDDGSTDNTKQVVEEFQKKDKI
jgi:glycosyltransferase involved in cell wall biosynthesis